MTSKDLFHREQVRSNERGRFDQGRNNESGSIEQGRNKERGRFDQGRNNQSGSIEQGRNNQSGSIEQGRASMTLSNTTIDDNEYGSKLRVFFITCFFLFNFFYKKKLSFICFLMFRRRIKEEMVHQRSLLGMYITHIYQNIHIY